jgi:uncharacterized membrane protein
MNTLTRQIRRLYAIGGKAITTLTLALAITVLPVSSAFADREHGGEHHEDHDRRGGYGGGYRGGYGYGYGGYGGYGGYTYAQPVYAPPPVYYPPVASPGIGIMFPLNIQIR